MAPSRPFWKGYLKLSLVSCPIAMFPASSSSERVSFRQINKTTGNRLKQQLVDSVTGDVVETGSVEGSRQIWLVQACAVPPASWSPLHHSRFHGSER